MAPLIRETRRYMIETMAISVPPATSLRAEVRKTMNGKPVLYRENARTALTLNSDEFHEKLLCDGLTMNLGDACAFSCEFCYVGSAMQKIDKPILDAHNKELRLKGDNALKFEDVVIRRPDAVGLLRSQLLRADGSARYPSPADRRVVYSSTLVDVAANLELLRETAEACNLIFEHTSWQVRLLSKSHLLRKLIEDRLIPEKHHARLILGFSTGTLDDRLARAFETGTALVSKRIESLHWLPDRGIRTFGMICPSLPQENYYAFSREICDAIRIDRCEHVWGEVMNVRGNSLIRTLDALRGAKLNEAADQLASVSGPGKSEDWEKYARATFLAHTRNVAPGKLRFLQYIEADTADWWSERRDLGAVLLGKAAKDKKLTVLDLGSRGAVPLSAGLHITGEDAEYQRSREALVTDAVNRSIEAAQALDEIHAYKDGLLWRAEFPSFEAYCRDRWGYAKSHAYRLRESGEFIADLRAAESHSPIGEWLPRNESQIRPVLSLQRTDRIACWTRIVAATPPEKLTGRKVNQMIRAGVEEKRYRKVERPKSKTASDVRTRALRALKALEQALESLNPTTRTMAAFTRLKRFLEDSS